MAMSVSASRVEWSGLSAAIGLVTLAAVTVAAPLVFAGLDVWAKWDVPLRTGGDLVVEAGGWAALLGWTVAVASGIGIMATAVAIPAAWHLRARGPGWALGAALVALPLLVPAYLAYAAYSTLREGASPLATALGSLPSGANAGISRALALAGLVLWIWPLAALLVGARLSQVPRGTVESLRIDGAGRLRRAGEVLWMCRGTLLASAALIAVVMAGSAVPLHLAQVPTVSIYLWKLLDLVVDPALVWRAALPLAIIGVITAEVIARRVARPASDMGTDEREPPPSRVAAGLSGGLWLLAVPVPIVLFAVALREWGMLGRFWQENGAPVAQSVAVAVGVGAVTAMIALATWCLLGTVHRAGWVRHVVAGGSTRLFLIGALVPGVMLGAAIAATWNRPGLADAVGASPLVLVLAHTARFGFVGALTGWLLWRMEPADHRDARASAGGSSWRAWWLGAARPQLGAVLGAGLVGAVLSFHEVEASVILQPPGTQSMARRLLEYLHYLKDQQVAAAAVNLMVAATLVAVVGGVLVSRGLRRASEPTCR